MCVQRSADSSSFLGESADQALYQMITHIHPLRSLGTLSSYLDHKNTNMRIKSSYMLAILLKQHGCSDLWLSKEADSLKTRLARLLEDSSPETRATGRDVIRILICRLSISRSEIEVYVKADHVEKALCEAVNSGGSHHNTKSLLQQEQQQQPGAHLPHIHQHLTQTTGACDRSSCQVARGSPSRPKAAAASHAVNHDGAGAHTMLLQTSRDACAPFSLDGDSCSCAQKQRGVHATASAGAGVLSTPSRTSINSATPFLTESPSCKPFSGIKAHDGK
jgi:hypothetical protein